MNITINSSSVMSNAAPILILCTRTCWWLNIHFKILDYFRENLDKFTVFKSSKQELNIITSCKPSTRKEDKKPKVVSEMFFSFTWMSMWTSRGNHLLWSNRDQISKQKMKFYQETKTQNTTACSIFLWVIQQNEQNHNAPFIYLHSLSSSNIIGRFQ